MGEMMGKGNVQSNSPMDKVAQDLNPTKEPSAIKTDVDDVFADGERSGLPVFDVSNGEFNQNMSYGRKRLRFKSGTSAQAYMSKTRYNKPFWIRDMETNYIRKIK